MSDSDTAEMLLLLTNGGGECTWDAQTSTAAVAKWTAMRAPKWGNCNAHGRCRLRRQEGEVLAPHAAPKIDACGARKGECR